MSAGGAEYSLLKTKVFNDFDLASQALCQAGARTDEEDSPVSCDFLS